VGHVLTHLARNADAHSRRLEGALRGDDVPKYAGGAEQRAAEIDEGADRPVEVIIEDLASSQARLEALFDRSAAAGWPNGDLRGDASYGPRGCPAHRLREVEMHHVDLGIGYEPHDWPADYVAWDLGVLLGTVVERLPALDDQRLLMAWLAGRGSLPTDLHLEPWG
jgi:maleylpyruvate isomerase